jgi:tetratricopeptide (TPR) repeat protein
VPVTTSSPRAREEFEKGRGFEDNIRSAEALEHYRRALQYDPSFGLALALVGKLTPGPEGDGLLKRAVAVAKDLPEPERLLIKALVAEHSRDSHEMRGLYRALAKLVPDDWRILVRLGYLALRERRWLEASAVLRRAIELNPSGGEPYNMMAYALANEGRHDEAIRTVQKYAALRPNEPNPRDSLGEILMMAGRLEEAEAAFLEAIRISPKFWRAWEGAAISRFARGAWAAGREALLRAKEAATLPAEKLSVDGMLADGYAIRGDLTRALTQMDEVERGLEKLGLRSDLVGVNLHRASFWLEKGKPDQALREVALAFHRLGGEPPDSPGRRPRYFQANLLKCVSLAKLRRVAEARRLLPTLKELASSDPEDQSLQSQLHFARGVVALAAGDRNAAVQHFSQCIPEATQCQVQLVAAQEELGDAPGAAATRARAVRSFHRCMRCLYFRARLLAGGRAPKGP